MVKLINVWAFPGVFCGLPPKSTPMKIFTFNLRTTIAAVKMSEYNRTPEEVVKIFFDYEE